MKKVFLLIIMMIFIGCSNDDDDNNGLESFSDFQIYKKENSEFGKVLSGKSNSYLFSAFGDFKSVTNSNDYIPKNIKFIEQVYRNNNDRRNIIKLDNNYLPSEFYQIQNNVISDTIYHVSYDEDKTLIKHDVLNPDNSYTTFNITSFSGIFSNSNRVFSIASKQNDDCNDPFDEDGDWHPCSDNSIYQQFADDARDSAVFHYVGVAIGWLVESFRENVCESTQSQSRNSNNSSNSNLTCDDYEVNEIIDNICEILQNCEIDCNGENYGSAYIDDCGNCVGGNTSNNSCLLGLLMNNNWNETAISENILTNAYWATSCTSGVPVGDITQEYCLIGGLMFDFKENGSADVRAGIFNFLNAGTYSFDGNSLTMTANVIFQNPTRIRTNVYDLSYNFSMNRFEGTNTYSFRSPSSSGGNCYINEPCTGDVYLSIE